MYPAIRSLTVSVQNKAVRLSPCGEERYAVVKSTYEMCGKSRPTLNRAPNYRPENPAKQWTRGLPDTVQYQGATKQQNESVSLTKELQQFWYNECVALDPGQAVDYYNKAWESLTSDDRWTTNMFGSGTCANYISDPDSKLQPMRFFTLLTGRATIKLVDIVPKKIYGAMCYPFHCINANASLNGISYATHPHLFYKPMNSVRTPLLNEKGQWLFGRVQYKEDGYGAFPQFHGKVVTPLFMPFTSIGWIAAEYVRLLAPDEPPPPVFNM